MRETDVVFQVLGTTVYVHVILLLVTCTAEYFILIVTSFDRLPDVEVVVVTIVSATQLILIVCIVVWRHSLYQLRYFLVAERSIEVHLGLALRTALGCNNDNTIGTTGTIDGCSGSILQYVDSLDFAWSDIADRTYREAVNDVERRVIL